VADTIQPTDRHNITFVLKVPLKPKKYWVLSCSFQTLKAFHEQAILPKILEKHGTY